MAFDDPALDPALHELSFDQYGRYAMIREILGAARATAGSRLLVLDVGGFARTRRGAAMLPAHLFLPDDDIVVVDFPECDLPGYVRGDGRDLQFDDGAFDFVISCDTLEHVPANDRAAFWRELLRVARRGVVLAAPFASPEVLAAEELVRKYVQAELGELQPQLEEHHQYGLPRLTLAQELISSIGLHWRCYPTGYVHAWTMLMLAKHYLFGRTSSEDDLPYRLDAYYTRFFGAGDRREPAYRHVFAVASAGEEAWLESADAVIVPTVMPPNAEGPGWPELSGWLPLLASLGIDERRVQALDRLGQVLAAQSTQIAELNRVVAQRDAAITDLEARANWLDEQAREARRALLVSENGRVMRLLRWLSGRRA